MHCPISPLPIASTFLVAASLCHAVYAADIWGHPLKALWPPFSHLRRGQVLYTLDLLLKALCFPPLCSRLHPKYYLSI
jgi:hypothetical protein